MRAGGWAVWAAFAATLGCRTPTEMVVDLSTTADCPAVEAAGTSITAVSQADLADAAPSAVVHACDGGTIGSLVLVPSGRNDDRVAVQVVSAVSGDVASCNAAHPGSSCIVARRLVRYVAHERLHLPIVMRASCAGVSCAGDETCVDGRCASATCAEGATCDETTLTPADAGAEVGAPTDAAPDALFVTDAGLSDAGIQDAGALTDAGLSVVCVFADDPTAGGNFAVALGKAMGASVSWSYGAADAGLTPTPAQMELDGDVALVWSHGRPFASTMGDTVATYLESGRQVVLAGDVYLAPNLGGIGGRMQTSYMLMNPGTVNLVTLPPIFVAYQPSSPVLAGVSTVSMVGLPITTSVRSSAPVAEWLQSTTSNPAVVTGAVTIAGISRNRVDLNLQPIGLGGDGMTLLANALRYR